MLKPRVFKGWTPFTDIAGGHSTGTKPTGSPDFASRLKEKPCPPIADLKIADEMIVALPVDSGCDNGISTSIFAVFILIFYEFS